MAKRKNIPKSIRFEVFKRDSFKCQYCGRSAPDVILECDHIHPVSEGGDNSLLNLITSCRDCNRGKGKKLLNEKSWEFAFSKIGGICYNRKKQREGAIDAESNT